MPAGLTKRLDNPELKKKTSQFTAMKKPGNKHNFSGVRLAAIVKVDLAVSPDVVTILLLESVRKC
jgi:hypothetical protein